MYKLYTYFIQVINYIKPNLNNIQTDNYNKPNPDIVSNLNINK